MKGALTTELPRQPQRSESNISCKGNIDYQTFAPRPLRLGITSVGRRDACSSDQRLYIYDIYVIYDIGYEIYLYTPWLDAAQFQVFLRLCPKLLAVLQVSLTLAGRTQKCL